MNYNVKINPSGVSFQSEQNLLGDALKNSIPLEYSCKVGECGICLAEIVTGKVENENGEIVQKGTILTCKSRALSNVVLKAKYHPELASQKLQSIPCKVAGFDFVTDNIIVIKFRFPPTVKFDFLPGQYVDLSFKGIKRSYSIASSKQLEHGVELHIRRVVGGKMSEILFSGLKENQLMQIEGPKGTFFIRKSNRPLILIAGGTGIAPVKSILEELIAAEDKRNIYVYWGMTEKGDFYLEELNDFSRRYSNIHYTPVLSGGSMWNGRVGYVHQAVLDDFETLHEYDIYACGAPVMIEVAKSNFFKKGLLEKNFFSDAFTAAK